MFDYCKNHIGVPIKRTYDENDIRYYIVYVANEYSRTCVLVTGDGCLEEYSDKELECFETVI